MQSIKYTIIIPHHNIPDLLCRCLDTIPSREDIQVIVVDDNSDPSVVDFDNFPGLNRQNVEIIFSKEGKGAGYARNIGLSHAKGEWLLFIDADDFLLPSAFETIIQNIDNECDIIYFTVDSVYSDSLQQANRHLDKDSTITNLYKTPKQLEKYLRYRYTEPWGKLIKKTLVDKYDIKFDESLVANDYGFSVKTGYYAANIKVTLDKFYCVTVREGSLCNDMLDSQAKIISRLHVYEDVQHFLSEHNIYIYPFYSYVFGFYRTNRDIFNIIMKECEIMGYGRTSLLIKSLIHVLFSKLFLK